METVNIPKKVFRKILDDVQILIDDVEIALDAKVQERIETIESEKEKGKTEKDYYEYLAKRGIKVGVQS
ncbi:hypothetical protein HZA99_06390 [Candidatus Woesearchaeota archaeon]|nr:hypothetical protein [Candidatus Woesearchaeota archaeon]